MRCLCLCIAAVLLAAAACAQEVPGPDAQDARTAVDVLQTVYEDCVQKGSFACIKPKVLSFLSSAMKEDTIRITRDLSIVRSAAEPLDNNGLDSGVNDQVQGLDLLSLPADPSARREALRHLLVDRVDRFLQSHQLRMEVPQELRDKALTPLVPRAVLSALPREIRLPLSSESPESDAEADADAETGVESARHHHHHKKHRHHKGGFMRKVVLPFILGLKFKTTALIPLALSLIALKTWKAFTLGLLSLVLSGAMVIFRFTKPKVVNYDVYHFPQHQHQHHGHYDVHHDHHGHDHAHFEHYDHHGYGRSADSLAYSAHRQ